MDPIHVLYGSQTGNAEFIAKDLAEKVVADGMPVECFELNKVKKQKLVLKEKASALIVVVSTTGNGDAPENCEAFWRSIKLRSAAKDMFSDLPYCVLGLGDTNYDKFCFMGKSMHKRIGELGGMSFMDLACADEGTGNLEETVEGWKLDVLPALKAFISKRNSANNEGETPSSSPKKGVAGAAQSDMPAEEPLPDVSAAGMAARGPTTLLPEGLEDVMTAAKRLGHAEKLASTPPSSALPRTLSATKRVDTMEDLLGAETAANNIMAGEGAANAQWTTENPYHATICGARWLTTPQPELAWDEEKRVIHMEVSIGNSGITYTPGDSIGIMAPNPKGLVDAVIGRLNEGAESQKMGVTYTRQTVVTGFNDTPITLGELLDYKVDLVSALRKTMVGSLASFCKDEDETKMLQWLCSKEHVGKALWEVVVEEQGLGIAELLILYPSCMPTLSALINILRPLAPRYYSIASSPLSQPNSVTVAFSVVRYLAGNRIKREGLCTTHLEGLLQPWLSAGAGAGAGAPPTSTVFNLTSASPTATPTIRIVHKVSVDFRLPGSVSPPLILIGPGTGVAPFLGFLDHRRQLEATRGQDSIDDACMGTWRGGYDIEENELPSESKTVVDDYVDSQEPGPITLFFGCRDNRDHLYAKEMQCLAASGTLSDLQVAYSRRTEEKVYVQHRMEAVGAGLVDLLLNQGAYVFICGDGNNMAKDVLAAFKKILVEHSSMDLEKANDFLTDLKARRRCVLDIWS